MKQYLLMISEENAQAFMKVFPTIEILECTGLQHGPHLILTTPQVVPVVDNVPVMDSTPTVDNTPPVVPPQITEGPHDI